MFFPTELQIKQALPSFLRDFYKFHERKQTVDIQKDAVVKKNVIADVFLSYEKADGQIFVSTVEAVSENNELEGKYIYQYGKLMVEIASIVVFLVGTFIFLAHQFEWLNIYQIGFLNFFLFLILGIIVLFSILAMIFVEKSRYKYIYAIEQFKRYHADDQWVAIADNVFTEGEEKYFIELKKQCVDHGFGLVEFNKELNAKLIFAPSILDTFTKKRPSILSSKFKLSKKVTFSKLSNRWESDLLRFKKRNYFAPSIILIFGTVLFFGIQGLINNIPILELNSTWFENKTWSSEKNIFDDNPQYARTKGQSKIYNLKVNQTNAIDSQFINSELVLKSGSRNFVYYDCSRIYNLDKEKYILKYWVVPEFHQAQNLIVKLAQIGIKPNVVWSGCFSSSYKGYLVFLGSLEEDMGEIKVKYDEMQRLLLKKGVSSRELAIIQLKM